MADATTVHVWLVAQARRRAAGSALTRLPAWPAAAPSTRLGLRHPQTHPAVAPTITRLPWLREAHRPPRRHRLDRAPGDRDRRGAPRPRALRGRLRLVAARRRRRAAQAGR